MIKSLRLKNVALIKSAEIQFNKGLNVLSGETGAGKTVIISAINFSLGAKADKTLISHGENFLETELIFDVCENQSARLVLDDFSIEYDDEVIVKRKLTIDGKNDIKINGSNVTLSMLKRFTSTLCDVYGQSEHYSLLNVQNQLKVLDGYAGDKVASIKEKISPIIKSIKELNAKLAEFGGNERDRISKIDILTYQINEIESANLTENEEEELISKKSLFKNVEKIGDSLSFSKAVLGEDNAALDLISTATAKIEVISQFSNKYLEIYNRLYSVKVEIDDLYSEIDSLLSNLDFNEQEFQYVEQRLDIYRNLKRKYGDNYNEINNFLQKAKDEYELLVNFEQLSKELSLKLANLTNTINVLYSDMSSVRKAFANKFATAVENELKTLGMKSAKFEIIFNKKQTENLLSENGYDDVEFMFSANAGEPLMSMSKIISGGEMSRFMLAMKIVCSSLGETYIFDEIDSGISGEVANIVAQKFAKLSQNSQIITISHLPQIVAMGDTNFKILKTEKDGATITQIQPLSRDLKVGEIERLIGGNLSEASILHAIELVQKADNFKQNNI